MKKNLFRIGAIALSLMLCLCGTLSVFAAPEATTQWAKFAEVIGGNGQVVVNTTDVEGAEGGALTATAYKLINVSNDDANLPAQPLYTWSEGVAAWVKANYPAYVKEGTDNVVSDEYLKLIDNDLDGLPVNDNGINAFAGAVSAAINGNDEKIDATKLESTGAPLNKSGEGESTVRTGTLTNLKAGSYLVLISGGKLIYRPSIANLTPVWMDANEIGEGSEAGWYVQSPQTLNIKAKPVNIIKTVNDPKAAIGDTVTYTITADVPVYPADKINSMFVIKDTMSKGLLYTADSVKVYGVVEGAEDTLLVRDTTDDNIADEGTNYTFVYTALTDGAHTGTFTVDLTKYYDTLTAYTSIKVTYDATITKDAVVGVEGNPNDATLEYSNDPYDNNSSTTKTTETKVYTYGLDLTKVDEKNHETKLAGAEFEVYKGDVDTAMKFVKDGEADGKYRVAIGNETGASATVITDANGKLDIRGLDVGDYKLKETKAPAGYVLLNGTVSFTITDDKTAPDGTDGADGIAEDADGNNSLNGYVSATVENHEGFNLPLTGGMGTLLFTAGGIVLIALAAVLLFAANRKKSSRD